MKFNKLKNIILLKLISVSCIHMINRFLYSISTSKNLLTNSNNQYYEWRFGKIRYNKSGTGNPLLLIHDLTIGSSLYEYNKLVNSLSEKHEVYSIDLLGYGLSDKTNMTYTNFLYVQLISDFIKNVIGRKTDIIATGTSSAISIMTAHNDSNLINKIIMINPENITKLNKSTTKRSKFIKFIIDLPIIGTLLYNIKSSKNNFQTLFKEEFFFDESHIKEEYLLHYIESSHIKDYNSKYTFSSLIARYMNCNIIHALKEINNSIYIIYGDKKYNIKEVVETYITYNNAIEEVSIHNTKHLPHLERPEKVLEQINIFL
ncbi:MAG: alpha/beta fold hydrolase [Lachnospiraceae bacterium]